MFLANVRLDWKVIASYKHSSLFCLVISDEKKVSQHRHLDVVAVAVVGPILAGLAGDVDLDLAELTQLRPPHVGQGEAEGDLVLAEVVPKKDPDVYLINFLCSWAQFYRTIFLTYLSRNR